MIQSDGMTYKAVSCDVIQKIFEKFNDHQLHCVIHFDGYIDENYFRRAVDMSADVFPIIRSKFIEDSNFKFPYWKDCKFTNLDMVKTIQTSNIEKTIEKLIVFKTKEKFGPQVIINIVRGRKSDSLCIIMNHMISDAAGFKEYLYMLGLIYSNLKNNPNYVLHIKKMGSRSMKQIFKCFNTLDKFKILLTSAKISKYNNGFIFPLEGDENNPFIVTRKISRERFILIKNYAKKNNATINDALVAAYLRVLSKMLEVSYIPLPCPVDLRKYIPQRKADGICNLTSNMVCDIGNDIGKTYNETLLKVKKSMDFEKKNFSCLKGPLMLDFIFDTFPYKKAKQIIVKLFKNPPIAMTNIGIISKDKLLFQGLNIKDAFITGSIKYKPYFQIGITTFNDEITLSINFCGTLNDKIKIEEFLYLFDDELPE